MFSFENDDARDLVVSLVKRYENHFKKDFPVQEYLETIKGIVTSENADRFKTLIDKRVEENKPVEIPRDFHKRLY